MRVIPNFLGVSAKQLKIQTNSQIQFEVPYTASTSSGEKVNDKLETQSIPIDSALSISMQWLKAILYLLLAVLIPVCLLWVYNAFIGCRLVVPERGVFIYHKKLLLDDTGVRVDPSFGSGALFQAGDMKLAPVGNGRVRTIALANLSVKGKFSWLSPFSTPFAEASNNNDKQVIGPDGANSKTRAGFSPLSCLALIFAHNPGPSSFTGSLFPSSPSIASCTEFRFSNAIVS